MIGNLQRVAWQHRRRCAVVAVTHQPSYRTMLSSSAAALVRRTRFQLQGQAISSSWHAARTLASAATSSQKRALNQEQLQGKPPAATAAAAPASATPPTASKAGRSASDASAAKPGGSPTGVSSKAAPPSGPSSASKTSGPFPVVAAAGAVLALGGGAFYYAKSNRDSVPASPTPLSAAVAPEVVAASKEAAEKPATAQETATKSATTTTQVVAPAAAADEPVGHRVLAIQVPEKMKGGLEGGASASAVPLVTHPPDGHRVVAVVPVPRSSEPSSSPVSRPTPARPPLVEETSMTQRALVQLQTATLEQANEAVVAAHQSLWSSGVADGGGIIMDAHDPGAAADGSTAHLQAKVARLASELAERTKWEAVRLKEFLAMKEQETAQKYQELLQTQRLEFEDILARRLREQEHALTTQFQQAIADKEASVQTLLQTALDTQQAEHENDKKAFEQLKAAEIAAKLEQDFGQKLEEYKAGIAQELERKVATLTELSQQLASLESALVASKSSREGSVKAHKLSATALALSQKLETSQPAGTELLALQAAAGEKGVIPAALKTIPTAVYSQGAATVPELQARFDDVYRQCRRAALVPEGRPGLEGQLAGIVFSSLKYPPGPDDPAPEDQPDHPEYVLVRAKRHVQLGELEKAVEQLEKLQGQVAFTASDWKSSALHRVAVEKALKVIKLECALVNESLVE